MPSTVTSTTNFYVPTTASGSINNTDSHTFQANLDLIVNNMVSMQTQLNHVIDTPNVSTITGDQHGKQSKSCQPDMTAQSQGYIVFVTSTILNIIWFRLMNMPPKACTFPVCIICLC